MLAWDLSAFLSFNSELLLLRSHRAFSNCKIGPCRDPQMRVYPTRCAFSEDGAGVVICP
jgi:hypothetical protein